MAYAKYGEAMTVDCPKCNEAAGSPCKSPSGATMDAPHADRRNAATAKAQTQVPPADPSMPKRDAQMAETMDKYAARLRAEAEAMSNKADALEMTAKVIREPIGV